MPRRPPPPHPKGAPRTPGSGRKKGTPNRKTVELRALMAALLNDVDYQDSPARRLQKAPRASQSRRRWCGPTSSASRRRRSRWRAT